MSKKDVKIRFYNTLWFRLVLGVFVCAAVGVSLISTYLNQQMSDLMTASVSEVYAKLNDENAARLASMLRNVEGSGNRIQRGLDSGKTDPEEIYWRMGNMMKTDPALYFGCSTTFRPGGFHGTNAAFYSYWKGGELIRTNLNPDIYVHEDWYTVPRDRECAQWSEPYQDVGGAGADVWMSTYSVPFYEVDENGEQLLDENGKKKFLGIVSVDIDLNRMQSIINSGHVYSSSYAVLYSPAGVPIVKWKSGENKFLSVSESDMNEVLQKLYNGESRKLKTFTLNSLNGKKIQLLGYQMWIDQTPWKVVSVVSKQEVLNNILRIHRVALEAAIACVFVLLIIIGFFAMRIVRPIKAIVSETDKIARGDLDESSSWKDYVARRTFGFAHTGEVSMLIRSVDAMRVNLKSYIASLGDSLVRQERIHSELQVAKNIQMSFLVKKFALSNPHLKLHAILEPAKEVGGDLYTFVPLDENRLFFVIGDVSGKGVPASLYMAVTLTLMKSAVRVPQGMEVPKPSEILKFVSTDLAVQNTNTMFVTAMCGIIDTRTGVLTYSNAGHLMPVLLHRDGTTPAEWVKLPPGLVLGIMRNPPYTDMELQLQDGDTLVFYTDGINEGMNKAGKLFGEENLIKTVGDWGNRNAEDIAKGLCQAVHAHADGAEQSDDMTVFAIQYTK